MHKPISLIRTTQNTRDLGGYKTKEESILRSNVLNFLIEKDFECLRTREITTVIDMQEKKSIDRKPSIFTGKEDSMYFNFQINEWSDVSKSMEGFPKSYMDIASSKVTANVFKCISNAEAGVIFN